MKSRVSRAQLVKTLVLISAFLLTACASLSKEECLTADWYAVGFEDGSRGIATTQFGEHRKACAKHGVQASLDRYLEGHEAGLPNHCSFTNGRNVGSRGADAHHLCTQKSFPDYFLGYREGVQLYCSAERGFDFGHQGKTFPVLCDTNEFAIFEDNYTLGLKVRDQESEIAKIEEQLLVKEKEYHSLEEEIQKNEQLIISDNTRSEVRRELIEQNKRLRYSLDAIDDDIIALQSHIKRKQARLNSLISK